MGVWLLIGGWTAVAVGMFRLLSIDEYSICAEDRMGRAMSGVVIAAVGLFVIVVGAVVQ